MLKDITLFGIKNKIEIALERLKTFEPREGYFLAFSGGKDSIVIKKLADMVNIKYDAHYNLTTIDPPELVQFIRQNYKDVIIDKPPQPFLKEMINRGFPTRQARWCCEYLKERGGEKRMVITGIRWDESYKRKSRKMIESCYKKPDKKFLNVIIDWKNSDIWEFIQKMNLSYCKLYDQGWKRIGCLFCPMAYQKRRLAETILYPQYVINFIKAFERLYNKKKKEGKKSIERWENGEEMFWWWIRGNKKKINDKQISFFI